MPGPGYRSTIAFDPKSDLLQATVERMDSIMKALRGKGRIQRVLDAWLPPAFLEPIENEDDVLRHLQASDFADDGSFEVQFPVFPVPDESLRASAQ